MPLNLSLLDVSIWLISGFASVAEMSQRYSLITRNYHRLFPLFLFVLPFPGTSIFFVVFLFSNSESFSIKYLISPVCELIGGWGSKYPGNIRSSWWVGEWVTVKILSIRGCSVRITQDRNTEWCQKYRTSQMG